MDEFVKQYLITALWAETDGEKPLDDTYGLDDISDEAKEQAKKDCDSFRQKAGSLLDGLNQTQVAHDFWLNRNRHGSGFWDGDYEKELGEKLSNLSHEFGEVYAYVGDDKKIYFQ